MNQGRGVGRAVFAAVLLTVGGVLNIIYGIAAIGNSKFFVHDTTTCSPASRVGAGSR